MSLYEIQGSKVTSAYQKDGLILAQAFDSSGSKVFPDSDPYLPGRTLVFEDDFNGASLDASKWEPCIGIFKQSNTEPFCYREENISFENSSIVFTAKREEYAGKPWTSAAIIGQKFQSFTYGRFEAKIKNSSIVGAFPAFWMMGIVIQRDFEDGQVSHITSGSWPECGEIDIYEFMPRSYPNMTTISANLWKCDTGQTFGNKTKSPVAVSDWHIYAIEWTADYIAALVDGVEYGRWTFSSFPASNSAAYHLPFYMMLNLAVGDSGGDPAATTNEMKMYVDWVRVYAPLNGA